MSLNKLLEKIGWETNQSLENGMKKTFQWIKTQYEVME